MQFFNSKNFITDTKIKEPLQFHLYKTAKEFGVTNVDSTIVSGPALQRHIYDARNTVSQTIDNKIYIVEIEKKIHEYQCDILESFKNTDHRNPVWIDQSNFPNMGIVYTYEKNVECICCSLENGPITNFIDADLMGTASRETGRVIRNSFIKQSENISGIKGFIYTTCLRKCSMEDSINGWLRNTMLPIIGCDIEKVDLDAREQLTIHKESKIGENRNRNHVTQFPKISYNEKGRLVHLSMYTYNDDGGSMFTGLIVYI